MVEIFLNDFRPQPGQDITQQVEKHQYYQGAPDNFDEAIIYIQSDNQAEAESQEPQTGTTKMSKQVKTSLPDRS
jgi:hypothetical protein